jgi:hypothetical protein
MPELSEEELEAQALDRLLRNIPFFREAFKIVNIATDLDEVAERISREYAFPTSANTLATILGIHTPHLISHVAQWDAYCNYCIKAMGNFYIPFVDDGTVDVIFRGEPTGYVQILSSKVYPSGRTMKRILPEDVVRAFKVQANACPSLH